MISTLTRQLKSDGDLKGLVWSLTPKAHDEETRWWARPEGFGILVLALVIALNLIFW